MDFDEVTPVVIALVSSLDWLTKNSKTAVIHARTLLCPVLLGSSEIKRWKRGSRKNKSYIPSLTTSPCKIKKTVWPSSVWLQMTVLFWYCWDEVPFLPLKTAVINVQNCREGVRWRSKERPKKHGNLSMFQLVHHGGMHNDKTVKNNDLKRMERWGYRDKSTELTR
jgi:hypothetical protein